MFDPHKEKRLAQTRAAMNELAPPLKLHPSALLRRKQPNSEPASPPLAAPIFTPLEEVQQPPHYWPDPAPIIKELPRAPAFDAQTLLPPALAEFVMDEADRMSAAPDYVAAALIVTLGSIIGTSAALKPKRRDDWLVTPNLFGAVVGEPSAKKSPSTGVVLRFLDRLEAKEHEALAGQQQAHAAELAAYEVHQAVIKDSMKKAAKGKGDSAAMLAAQNDMATLAKPKEPHARRFKSNDSTVEKLGDILANNPQGLLVYRDELMGLLASWEKEGREGDRAFYLEAWNGTGSFSVDRIQRGSLHIPTLCLSVFGGIQPDLLERYLATITDSMDNDGRIQRFQVMVYPEQPAWRWVDRYPVQGAREAMRDLFEHLASFDPLQDGATAPDEFTSLPHFAFDDAAQEVFIEWATDLNTQRIPDEASPIMAQHLAKYEKLFCALALILHLASSQTGNVKTDSALRAAAWCSYLEGHARRIYGLVESARVDAANLLARRISEGKLADNFTARDVWKKGWSGIKTAAQADTALTILEAAGWVLAVDDEDKEGGRPTTRYLINPKAKGQKNG